MQRTLHSSLLAVITVSSLAALATAAKPYSNYGFYSPYPPPPDQAIYDFAPVQQVDSGHRSTRDSAVAAAAWRDEFDAFLDGDREPTCDELREMWNYARNLQQRAVRSRQGREQQQPAQPPLPPFLAFSPLEESKEGKGSGGGGSRHEANEARLEEGGSPPPQPPSPPRQANRRRMSTPPNTPGRGRPRPPVPPKVTNAVRGEGEGEAVYGVVKTHAPPKTTMHVRDPAKAIYSLLKEKSLLGSAGGQHIFGKVRAHAQPEPQGGRAPSYMDILEEELYGARDGDGGGVSGGEEDSYGSVKYEVSSEDDRPRPASSFEQVRALVAAERARTNGAAAAGEGGSAFDLIRERLMKTPPPPPPSSSSSASKLRSRTNKAFRRKSSRKNRQRNVSATRVHAARAPPSSCA